MVPPHPLIKHWLAIARNKHSPTPIFRAAIAELGKLLIYELGRDWLPTIEATIDSPVGPADAQYVDPMRPVKVAAACPLFMIAHIPVIRQMSAWRVT